MHEHRRSEAAIGLIIACAAIAACGSESKPSAGPPPLCAMASRCGQRHYCSTDNGCICAQAAEGDLRCGALPSCGARLCTKSADCADLGAGYFCDTPKSGCCDEAGKEKQRCLAPCMATLCPESQICGRTCCPAGQTCVRGACAAAGDGGPVMTVDAAPKPPVADAAVPHDAPGTDVSVDAGVAEVDAPESTGGIDALEDPDGPAAPTAESLIAARMALAGGATEVALSPDGRIRYRREVAAGHLVHQEVLVDGKQSVVWDHTPAMSMGRRDRQLDGVFETKLTIDRSTPGAETLVTTVDPTGMGMPVSRETYTNSPTTIGVVIEKADATGALVVDQRYQASRLQPLVIQAPDPGTGPGDCTQAQIDQIRDQLASTISEGLACSRRLGLGDLVSELASKLEEQSVAFHCTSLPAPSIAQIDIWDGLTGGWGGAPIGINIDPGRYFGSPNLNKLALWHELLHSYFGSHSPYDNLNDPRTTQIDKTYACSALCFDPNATKCQCGSCLGLDKCDKRCDTFKSCEESWAACRCIKRPKTYPTLTECKVDCPSGLACFASDCIEVKPACH